MGTAVIRVVRWSATSIYRAGIEGEVCFDLTLFVDAQCSLAFVVHTCTNSFAVCWRP